MISLDLLKLGEVIHGLEKEILSMRMQGNSKKIEVKTKEWVISNFSVKLHQA